MNISRPGTMLIAMALFTAPIMLLSSCSDSEKRLPVNDSMAKVLLNVGGSAQAPDGRMAASAPPDITAVSVTVTGPGMIPINKTDTSTTGVIDLDVPAGPARLFAVTVATASGGLYSGTAVASLPAGVTVSVPVVMENGGLFGPSAEGSPSNPVLVLASETGTIIHTGTVNTGMSYYYMDPGTYTMFSISVMGMTDDVDLLFYGPDSSYETLPAITFGKNLCGRLKDESESGNAIGLPVYFAIDGSHTKRGAAYQIVCKANDGEDTTPPFGTHEVRNYIQVGLPYDSRIETPASPINYYATMVIPGVQYWVNMYDNDPASTLLIYNPYPTPVASPLTAATNLIMYNVTGMVTDDFTLEVVTNEGTSAAPVTLYADDMHQTGRANYCMVGGSAPSYYRIAVTGETFEAYLVRVTSIRGNVGMEIYRGPSFESIDLVATSNEPDEVDETYSGPITGFPDGYIYVKVFNSNTSGSSFVLYAMGDIF